MRFKFSALLATAMVLVVAAAMPLIIQGADAPVLQAFDFSQDEIDSTPKSLNVPATDGHGVVEVVSAPDLPSGRALRILAPASETKHYITARTPRLKLSDPKAAKLCYEFLLKWVQGTGGSSNFIYITVQDSHRIIMLPSMGMLKWHARDAGMLAQDVAVIGRDWHRVRVVADRIKSEATLYIDDMNRPYLENLPLHRAVDSWDGTQLILRSETAKNEAREVLYADLRIWVED